MSTNTTLFNRSAAESTRLVRLELFRSANGENLDEAMTLLRGQTTPAEWLVLADLFDAEFVHLAVEAAVCRAMARGAVREATAMLADVHGVSVDGWLRYASSEHPS